jgi:hypothetical protein
MKLLNPRSTALDENTQHDDKESAGNNPDNGYAFHISPPLNE